MYRSGPEIPRSHEDCDIKMKFVKYKKKPCKSIFKKCNSNLNYYSVIRAICH